MQAKAAEVKVKAEEVKDKVKGKLNKNACGCTCEETAEETEEAVPAEDVAVEETAGVTLRRGVSSDTLTGNSGESPDKTAVP